MLSVLSSIGRSMKLSASLMKISLRSSGLLVQRAGLGPRYQPMIFPPFSPTGWPYLAAEREEGRDAPLHPVQHGAQVVLGDLVDVAEDVVDGRHIVAVVGEDAELGAPLQAPLGEEQGEQGGEDQEQHRAASCSRHQGPREDKMLPGLQAQHYALCTVQTGDKLGKLIVLMRR
jgi:hypothetical protein